MDLLDDIGPMEIALLRGADPKEFSDTWCPAGATILWLLQNGYLTASVVLQNGRPILSLARTQKSLTPRHAVAARQALRILGLDAPGSVYAMHEWLSQKTRERMAFAAKRALVRRGYISIFGATFLRRAAYTALFFACVVAIGWALQWLVPGLGVWLGLIAFAFAGVYVKDYMPQNIVRLKKGRDARRQIRAFTLHKHQWPRDLLAYEILLHRGYTEQTLEAIEWHEYTNKPAWIDGVWPEDNDLAVQFAKKIVGLICGIGWPVKSRKRAGAVEVDESEDLAMLTAEAISDFVGALDNAADSASYSSGDNSDCDFGGDSGDCGDGGGDWN